MSNVFNPSLRSVSEALIYGAWMLAEALSFAPSFAAARRSAARIFSALGREPTIFTEPTAVECPDWVSFTEKSVGTWKILQKRQILSYTVFIMEGHTCVSESYLLYAIQLVDSLRYLPIPFLIGTIPTQVMVTAIVQEVGMSFFPEYTM